jgi:para-nitrobenzyl esterase
MIKLFSQSIILCGSYLLLVCFQSKHLTLSTIRLNDTVRIEQGLISGTKNKEGDILVFRGIPFAAPPVGNLRWKAPQPVSPWKGVKVCDAFGASPMQGKPAPFSMWSEEFLIPKEPISEDCLYLNVWTSGKSTNKKAVLVWIYGGGFSSGGSAVPIYDGEAMAKKGIVFVSINYRVGVFGFFAHPELTAESKNHASGNYGLLDQIAALQWVKKNIAVFGGDPNNVTIAGQSAGSMSVNCLVASPLAKGLFKKAIAESGAVVLNGAIKLSTLQQAEQDGIKAAQSLKANSISELRNISAEELLKKAQGMHSPIVDGYVLPESVADIFRKGKENDVVLLTGWNENEGLLFGPKKSAAGFRSQLATQYGADSTMFLKYYPASSDAEASESQLNLSRDLIFGLQNYTWANLESMHGKKVYVYRFTRKLPAYTEAQKFGAFHTGEVPYAYSNLKFVKRPWENADRELEKVMSTFFINFIKSGDPNGPGLPEWPAYTYTKKEVMILGDKQEAKKIPDEGSLDFLYSKLMGK